MIFFSCSYLKNVVMMCRISASRKICEIIDVFSNLFVLFFSIRLQWLAAGDPNDHHSVMPCAPEKRTACQVIHRNSPCKTHSNPPFYMSLCYTFLVIIIPKNHHI
jgi:hypothetical protein